jgi:ElaB/YqjD/DUF883 family membrane-anchored ribosome-binding protein
MSASPTESGSPSWTEADRLAALRSFHVLDTNLGDHYQSPEPDRPDQQARSSSADEQQDQPEQNTAEHLLDQVREALHDVADQASGPARDVYNGGEHYARQAREQYPEAEQYVRDGQQAVTNRVTANPLLALLMAGVAGYVLAWLIHGKRRDRERGVPDYGRTSRGYAPRQD